MHALALPDARAKTRASSSAPSNDRPLDASAPFDGAPAADRRRRPRVPLRIDGRYMLQSGGEYPCRTDNVSPVGFALAAYRVGEVGERVVAYFPELGRIEGVVVRRGAFWFALDINAPEAKRERLANKIAWLTQRAAEGLPNRRAHERLEMTRYEPVLVQLGDRVLWASVADLSIAGAALLFDDAPPIGSPVVVNGRWGRTARHFPGGVGVTFDD